MISPVHALDILQKQYDLMGGCSLIRTWFQGQIREKYTQNGTTPFSWHLRCVLREYKKLFALNALKSYRKVPSRRAGPYFQLFDPKLGEGVREGGRRHGIVLDFLKKLEFHFLKK